MKKDNSDKIIKSSLSTLLKRFSNTDVISTLSKEYNVTSPSMIPLDKISDNSILRKARLNEKQLSEVMSILKEKGFSSPLYIIKKDENFETLYPRIVYIAARKLKLESVPCVLLDMSEEDALMFLAAKLQERKDSSIIEMSLIFNKIQKKLKYEQKDIANAMHLSRSQVTNIIRLIKMPENILLDVAEGKLSFGHVRALSTLNEEQINQIVEKIYENHLSVREVEKMVYEIKHQTTFQKEEDKLAKKYQCKVSSLPKKITFSFANEEEKNKFINKITKAK